MQFNNISIDLPDLSHGGARFDSADGADRYPSESAPVRVHDPRDARIGIARAIRVDGGHDGLRDRLPMHRE